MKKIIIGFVVMIILAILVFVLFHGIEIGNFKINPITISTSSEEEPGEAIDGNNGGTQEVKNTQNSTQNSTTQKTTPQTTKEDKKPTHTVTYSAISNAVVVDVEYSDWVDKWSATIQRKCDKCGYLGSTYNIGEMDSNMTFYCTQCKTNGYSKVKAIIVKN